MIVIEVDIGQGPRRIEINPENITLGFLEDLEEAQTASRWAPIRTAVASLLGLTRDESRAITLRQFNEIGQALQSSTAAQTAIPNG